MDRKKVIMIILPGVATVLLMIVLAGQFLSHKITGDHNNIVTEMLPRKEADQSLSGSDNTAPMADRTSEGPSAGRSGTISGESKTGDLHKTDVTENSDIKKLTDMPARGQNTRSTINRGMSGSAGNEAGNKHALSAPCGRDDSAMDTSEESVRRVGGTDSGNNGSGEGTGELFEGEEKVILPSEVIVINDEKNAGSNSKELGSKAIDDSVSDPVDADSGINSGFNSNLGAGMQSNIYVNDEGENKSSGQTTNKPNNNEADRTDHSLRNEDKSNANQNPKIENDQGMQNREDDDTPPRKGIELPVLLF